MRNSRVILGLFLLLGILPSMALAENAATPVDTTRLENLYTLQLKGSQDPNLQKRIQSERERVRGQIDDQLSDLVNAFARTETGASLNLSSAIAQQRAIVTALTTKRDSTQVDLDLLAAEEEHYYKNPSTETGTVNDEGRITKSEADLLAHKAVLEEQAQAVDFFLSIQNDRLSKLQTQQQFQQFSLFITIGKYFLLFFFIIAFERIVRMRFLTRIHSKNARYIAMKLFTASVYAITVIWILALVSAEYPGILTSVAILGAGVAIALQDIFKDIVGWVVIVQKRLFTLGHRVSIGSFTGDIVDIGLLSTTMLEAGNTIAPDVARTGQVLSIPNSAVLTQPVLNYSTTSDYIDAEISFILSYESDLAYAEELLRGIVTEETQQYAERARRQTAGRLKQFFTSHEPLGARVALEPSSRGIRIALRFPTPMGERRVVMTRITKRVFAAINAEPKRMRVIAEPYQISN